MSIQAGALRMGRMQAERLHTCTFTVYRSTGRSITDPITLEESPEFATIHAAVMGKFQATNAQPRDGQVPGMKVAETGLGWHTSISTLGVLTDDEVLCIASPDDPGLVGKRVRVTGPFMKSHATARRFHVKELS